jgi:hypothetical protein
MTRSSLAIGRGPSRVLGGELLRKGPRSAACGRDALHVAEGSEHSPPGGAPPIGDLHLVLVTGSGFEVPLVASPAQAKQLLRSSGEACAAEQGGVRGPKDFRERMTYRPRPVTVDQILSRSRLASRFCASVGGGAR